MWQDGEARVLVTAVAEESLDLTEMEDSGGNRGLCLEERQNLICVFVVISQAGSFYLLARLKWTAYTRKWCP